MRAHATFHSTEAFHTTRVETGRSRQLNLDDRRLIASELGLTADRFTAANEHKNGQFNRITVYDQTRWLANTVCPLLIPS